MTRSARPLSLLSVVIPARDEEGCIASIVEHLHVELRLRDVPHEIFVVNDGSSDKTWEILTELRGKLPELRPVQNTSEHGFGKAVARGLDEMEGDVHGYSWITIPITWRNRRTGNSKLKIKEMGSRYLFVLPLRMAGEIFQPGRLPETQ
jgi:glycosyltransferase involved in cell wall biosynthesis